MLERGATWGGAPPSDENADEHMPSMAAATVTSSRPMTALWFGFLFMSPNRTRFHQLRTIHELSDAMDPHHERSRPLEIETRRVTPFSSDADQFRTTPSRRFTADVHVHVQSCRGLSVFPFQSPGTIAATLQRRHIQRSVTGMPKLRNSTVSVILERTRINEISGSNCS
jgi:hypothetical protein